MWLDLLEVLLGRIMRRSHGIIPQGIQRVDQRNRSSKSALHGLIHWLSQIYGPKGVTVNGVAPALITGTTMLPGEPEDLKSSIFLPSTKSKYPTKTSLT